MNKSLHNFQSHGSRCEADLFLPDNVSKPPVVVLAQGYAAERGFGTQGIINAIVDAGFAVFAFDYRGFGGSQNSHNEERQLVDPQRQLEDWQAALNCVAKLPSIDAQRMGLWGSSYAGGHVLSVAGSEWSNAFSIRAVVAQIPHCDSRSAAKHVTLKQGARAAGNIVKGLVFSSLGMNHTIAVVGKPDDAHFSVLNFPGWYEGYLRMVPPGSTWVNAVPAKSLLRSASYNPIDTASNIKVPVLMVYGAKDQGIPVDDVQRTSNRIKHVELFCFDGDHFDVYDGGVHQPAAIAKQVEFFCAKL